MSIVLIDYCSLAFTFISLVQALHATVLKQLEAGELLEKLRESQCQVSSFLKHRAHLSCYLL